MTLPDNLPVFCAYCGRKLKLRPGASGWFLECPKWGSFWAIFRPGGGNEHTLKPLPYTWQPPPRFDPQTGEPR